MRRPKVFITRELFSETIEKIEEFYEVDIWDKYQEPSYEELVKRSEDADALLTLVSDRIDCNLLKNAKRLRIVAQCAVGYNNIDVSCATALGIYVTNTPGVLTEATAELTWALLMSVARRIVESDHFVRFGEWWRLRTAWHPKMLLGSELNGKKIGIIGFGRIGRKVAEYAKAFGMKILYYDIVRNERAEKELGAEFRELDDLLRESDFVTIHVPLTEETHHLISERELRMMKRSAILVNTSRGGVVDTEALVRALREGWIAGAGLDVFEEEPLPENHELTAFKNVVLLPHIGSATHETRRAMANLAAENLISFAKGEIPPTLVNGDVLSIRAPGFT
ncbi:MAG: D-glycerate dehydrogenase [Archaeoglobi archaeon]|nr:D-glycerate dehydrogenase [Candidatus Mnemosynella sp.]